MKKLYVASKTKHGRRWQELRDAGWPIISTWIDEASPGQSKSLSDLWDRCIRESREADAVLAYRASEDEVLKGAYIEIGSALGAGKPVMAAGAFQGFTFCHHKLVTHYAELGIAWLALADAGFLAHLPMASALNALTLARGYV